MPTLTIKGIPDELYRRLKRAAQESRRSLNAEVIQRLEGSLGAPRLDADAFLADLEAFWQGRSAPPLDDEALRRVRDEGRA